MILELFHAWLSKPNLKSLVYPIVGDLVYALIYYQQISYSQLQNYIADANEFVVDENEDLYSTHSLSIRSSSNRLIIELIHQNASAKNEQFLPTIIQSIARRVNETENARELHHTTDQWWKLREAALMALGNSVPQLMKAISKSSTKSKKNKEKTKQNFCFPIEYFVALQKDASHPNSFLVYQALVCAAKCARFIPDYNSILPYFDATVNWFVITLLFSFFTCNFIKQILS